MGLDPLRRQRAMHVERSSQKETHAVFDFSFLPGGGGGDEQEKPKWGVGKEGTMQQTVQVSFRIFAVLVVYIFCLCAVQNLVLSALIPANAPKKIQIEVKTLPTYKFAACPPTLYLCLLDPVSAPP